MPIEHCQRPYCGGWARMIVNSDGEIEKFCSKCARPMGMYRVKANRASSFIVSEQQKEMFNSLFRTVNK